ncbi:HAD hydrolase-like protein [Halalkalibacterium halodurans]|jgi:adenosylhomocysteine nucleosidase|uniref:BH0430 protein n=2 Tax=Halalkalibacterium halodurans TaxID=86665 RepID=Q9KFP8_HALH5|nr:HAD family hydrolase [Halalkalibacterium halodurans]MDY7220932.1 HAD hydrolase-like protein [Halalkalibacterium halodurans]MDY7240171.1 HAD hydrolase-like protein [Halalkalibacterium halodurans]MED4082522.1 HAD hydrolase-like protein [Halalkalibacterium halodurans]MED4085767.1 HAD hydrolase-like protein [Halalkalibacterium halodurans]MED4105633.1 HAD hydrolase-like protein [Halalkalibacterium halodurans]
MTTIIFDMDGTLFQTDSVLEGALEKTFDYLRQTDRWQGETPIEQYLAILGAPMHVVWETIMPSASHEERQVADQAFWDFLLEEIRLDHGKLYPNVGKTLEELYQLGYDLYVASNGFMRYLQAIVDHYGFTSYLKDIYGADRFETASKTELVAKLVRDYRIEGGVMVGDRSSDLTAGADAKLVTIGCLYGYGTKDELDSADVLVEDISEIRSIVSQRLENHQKR